MDLSFSPRAQPILSSTSLFPLPTSLRREFSGCGTQLSLPGLLRSRRRCRRTETLAPSPRCATQDVIFENSAVTVAAVVAAMAALQIYLNYARRLREDTECSDQAISTGVEHFNQDTEITEQETFQVCTSESFYTEPFLFERSITVEGVENDVCSEKVNSSSTIYDDSRPQHGYFDSGADKLLARSPRTDVLSSSAKVIPMIGVVMKDCVASEMPDFLHGKFDESEMLLGRTSNFFSIPVKKKREMNKKTGQEHITTEGGDFLVSGYGRLLEASCYSKEKLPDLSSISCFRSISSEPLLLTQHDKIGSYALRSDRNVPEAGPLLTSEYLEGRGPISCFKEYPGNKKRGSVEVHYSAHLVSSLLHKDSNRKFSRLSQPNGNFVKDESDPATSLRTYYRLLKDGRLKDCVDVLESLERKGLLDMEKVHHARFLTACRSQKAVMEAFQFCRLIKTPTLSTFNMLLSVCASSRDFDGAFQVMVLVKEAGLRPDYKLYTTLISTCGKCGKVDAMFEVFHEMVNAGVEPNVNTYGALIDGCARAGQVAKAFGAYGIMRSKGPSSLTRCYMR